MQGGIITDLDWSPDGRRIATGATDHMVRLWDVASPREPIVFEGHTDQVTAVRFSPTGRILASSSRDTTVRSWAVEGRTPLENFNGPAEFRSVSWAPDESRICAVQTKRIHIFSRTSGVIDTILFEHERWARRALWLPDGTIVSGGDDGQLIMWNVVTGRPFARHQLGSSGIRDLCFNARNGFICVGMRDGNVRLWSFEPRYELGGFRTAFDNLARLSVSADGSLLAATDTAGKVGFYAVESRAFICSLPIDGVPATLCQFHPRRSTIAVARGNETELWDLDVEHMISEARSRPKPAKPDSGPKTDRVPAPLRCDMLIVVAAEGEDEAVTAVDDGAEGAWEPLSNEHLPAGYGLPVRTRVYRTVDGRPLHVALTRAPMQRGAATTATAARLVDHLHPICLAMCGVCAGRPDLVTLGDVIIADRLYRYAGRQLAGKYVLDLTTYNLHLTWRQAAERFRVPDGAWIAQRPIERNIQTAWVLLELAAGKALDDAARRQFCPDWAEVLSGLWKQRLVAQSTLDLTVDGRVEAQRLRLLHPEGLPAAQRPRAHVGPLATVDDLIARAGIWQQLEISQGLISGLDMESSDLGFVGSFQEVPRLVVAKGVMDYADPDRQYGFRAFAARAAAEMLLAFAREQMDGVPELRARTDAGR